MSTATKMSIEDLLKPRYRLIADFPANTDEVGTIIDFNGYADEDITIEQWCIHFDKFNKIYKRLEWWEERKPEEMPRYVKAIPEKMGHDEVRKVKGYVLNVFASFENTWIEWRMDQCLPATESEYLAYTSQP